jgi:hypothetical protein
MHDDVGAMLDWPGDTALRVLSTISGTPALLAIFATDSMSVITPPGLAIDSMNMAWFWR